ncbi:MAG: hypothetical protein Q8N45_12795, partial [Anaerolineales bacterium]|nr:hypothetical protein [Anaerolineales bacterium]
MKPNLLFVFSILLLALLLSACGPLWQVNPLPPGTAIVSVTPNVVSPTVTSTPLLPTETPAALPVVASPAITSIDMLDEMNGWAIGEAYVLRTMDGGATWLNATPAGLTSVGFSATSFFMNATTAWVVLPSTDYTRGALYHTANGGMTWTSSSVPFSDGSLQFLDAQNGWMLAALGAGAGSEAVAVFQSTDAGATWSRVCVNDPTLPGFSDSLPLSGQKSGMTFLDATHGWVTGSVPMDGYVYLFKTQDGGHSWAHQDASLPGGFETAMTSADAQRFYTSLDGIFHLGLYAAIPATVFYVTQDGGATWTPTFPVNMAGRYAIANLRDIWVWDGGPRMLVSHDSGVTWSLVSTNINVADTLMQMDFVNATTGWALTGDVSSHYSLYKTTDGGATWTALIP